MSEILPDEDTRHYMQQLLGYAMTADIRLQQFWVLIGSGANGKSTMLNVASKIMGTYARAMTTSTIVKRKASAGPSSDLVRLAGARFVAASEIGVGSTLDDSLIKRLTGGDIIAARDLYKSEIEFTPRLKLLLAVNSLPNIKALDHGMWRRAVVIPFDQVIEKPDRELEAKLLRESPGILNWLIDGLQEFKVDYQLQPSSEIIKATAGWSEESNTVSQWIEEYCRRSPLLGMYASECYKNYRDAFDYMGRNEFYRALRKELGLAEFERKSNGAWVPGITPSDTQPLKKN